MAAGQHGPARLLLSCLLLLPGLATKAHASLDPNLPIRKYILQTWQTAQGLPQNTVLALAQTSDGYLWLGTEEGLVRFDGVRFTTLDARTTDLQGSTITTLLVDRNQNLWIGTNGGGLSCLHDGKFTTYTARNGLPSQSILSLYEDSKGTVWAGTDGGGLISLSNGRSRVFTRADGLPDNVIFSVTSDRHGTLWVGTRNGLGRSAGNRFTSVGIESGLGKEQVRAVRVSGRGDIWAGTTNGLYRLTSSGITRFRMQDGLTSNSVLSLFEDGAGTLWIGTLTGGLNRFFNGKFSSFTDKDGLVGKDVWSILEDHEGNLWAATAGGGLNCFKRGSFTSISKDDGLLSDMVLAEYQDSEGSLWFGSDKGLVRLKGGTATAYTTQQGLPDNFVFSVTEGANHEMWIGTRRGAARLKDEKITASPANGLPGDFVACTYTDHNGNVWIGTRGGLVRYDGHQFTKFTTLDGLSNNFVLSLYQDQEGTLWIGTSGGGLDTLKEGHFRAYAGHNGLSNDVVWSLNGDADGTIWIGTSGGGLNRFRNGKFTVYSSPKGLFDDAVLCILDDHLGHLWMSSDRGVFSVPREQLNSFAEGRRNTITSTVYGTADGMKSRECNGSFQAAGWRTRDGQLLFATTKGVAVVDPAHLVKNEVPPHVVIEEALVDNKKVPLDDPLVMPPGKGQLEFQFTAPTFIRPDKLEFRYMLEGFDKDWNQAGNRRVAYYTNIPHGEYRFRVKAGVGDLWSTNNASVAITLEPHFYQTKLFNFIVVLLAVSLCAGAYRLRVSALKMRELKLLVLVNERTSALQESEMQLRRSRDELENRVQERTSELVDANRALEDEVETRRRTEEQLILAKDAAEAASRAKSDFLANMSHEIRTPINGILGMTDITLGTELSEEQREYLDIVRFSADSLLSIVNDILDFSKIEAQKLILDCRPFELRRSVDELIRSLAIRARQKKLVLSCDVATEVPNNVIGDSLRLRQVLLNLLDNALKFTSKGEVGLRVRIDDHDEEEALLHFSVRDTGIGISPDKQKTIFEAFSQADTSSTRRYGGTGLGLTISYQLASMMQGRLWVESELGQGSTFHFTARVKRRASDLESLCADSQRSAVDIEQLT